MYSLIPDVHELLCKRCGMPQINDLLRLIFKTLVFIWIIVPYSQIITLKEFNLTLGFHKKTGKS